MARRTAEQKAQRESGARRQRRSEHDRELAKQLAEGLMNEMGFDALADKTVQDFEEADLATMADRLELGARNRAERIRAILTQALAIVRGEPTEAEELGVSTPAQVQPTPTRSGPPRPEAGPKSSWTQAELDALRAHIQRVGPYLGCRAFAAEHPDRSEAGAMYQYRTRLKATGELGASVARRTVSVTASLLVEVPEGASPEEIERMVVRKVTGPVGTRITVKAVEVVESATA